ncbi:DNA replication licensing factor MCM7 [Nematocida sp. AWRm77]|nr:DNA replication licensing factor MCM7 [Nematocida sp. AWRm77]
MEELRPYSTERDYAKEKDMLRRFILTFEENGVLKYMAQLKNLHATKSVEINAADLLEDGNTELYAHVVENTVRYKEMVSEIVDEMVKEGDVEMPQNDLFFEHRKVRVSERYPGRNMFDILSKGLLRFYSVHIYRADAVLFDDVSPERIGSLVTVRGVVSKASEVCPSISVAVFVCDLCTSEVFQEVEEESFLPITECQSEKCRVGKTKGTLHLQTRASKFRAKQVLRVQELSQEVHPGRIPRSLNVEVYDTLVQQAVPGAEVSVSGILLPKANEGIQKLRMGLLSDTYLLGTRITLTKTSVLQAEVQCSERVQPSLEALVGSVAPEIGGMEDVKKILLLMLIGGDTYNEGGMRIRGEINVLLVGDPGVAKSQLLKAVCRLSPRGMFTTGRGASGAGLTACVSRDQETGEYRLEGGALVMSDGGVCCIDEFDKMHESDRSCVHEAMEQHRISISKAGINTTLNARCSVLAAANPVKGRYMEKKSVSWNVGLPTALVSRFDAIKVLRDISGKEDEAIARHILGVHREKGRISGVLSAVRLAQEIDVCKSITTRLGEGVERRIVEAYACERSKTAREGSKEAPSTARKVLSVLRLSQALAKAQYRNVVTLEDVEEVLRLLGGDARGVYNTIMSVPGEDFGEYRVLDMETIYREASRFGRLEIDQCISEQAETGSWMLNKDRLTIFKV